LRIACHRLSRTIAAAPAEKVDADRAKAQAGQCGGSDVSFSFAAISQKQKGRREAGLFFTE
jgi:hypothetical protein